MDGIPERRKSNSRRRSDQDAEVLRAVIHDIGHEIATLTYLIEDVLAHPLWSDSARRYLNLAEKQSRRLSTMVEQTITPCSNQEPTAVRSLLAELVTLANAGGGARVVLMDGPPAIADVDQIGFWRILFNIVGNGVRAAGPNGTVWVSVNGTDPVEIEIADDGPGFGASAPGWASLGLRTVVNMCYAFGVRVSFSGREPAGTLVRLTLPARGA